MPFCGACRKTIFVLLIGLYVGSLVKQSLLFFTSDTNPLSPLSNVPADIRGFTIAGNIRAEKPATNSSDQINGQTPQNAAKYENRTPENINVNDSIIYQPQKNRISDDEEYQERRSRHEASRQDNQVKHFGGTLAPMTNETGPGMNVEYQERRSRHEASGQAEQVEHFGGTLAPMTNKTGPGMNACLFIMDDTIRLMEWIAYHYVLLPLENLVVAVDPKSRRIDKIDEILQPWREYINIYAYYNDTFMNTLDPHEGWGREVWGKNNRYRGWFKNKKGYSYRSQAHKRRQNFFTSFCFGELWELKKRQWTILTDTDEFLTYNYRYPETEDETKYDSETLFMTREEIDKERSLHIPFRDSLPRVSSHVTIAEYLQQYEKSISKIRKKAPTCIRFPGLIFGSHESNDTTIQMDVPETVDGTKLITLRQRQHAQKDGVFSKAMINLKAAPTKDWFQFGSVLNVHTPNRRMCGRTTKKSFSGSGADYISSLFRIHHYKAGTLESYLERAGDWRGGGLWRFYSDRNTKPVGENNDLTPWFKWFVEKVGLEDVRRLLLLPLEEKYEEIGNLRMIKASKDAIARLVPSLFPDRATPPEPISTRYERTNHSVAACMYCLDDTLRLMEWIAYHYSVLPLRNLVVGLDPMTTRERQIQALQKIWSPFVDIRLYLNESWLSGVGEHDGWQRSPIKSGKTFSDWYLNKNSTVYKSEAHKRRQQTFVARCLHEMKAAGHDLVFISDSDEFVIFNNVWETKSKIRKAGGSKFLQDALPKLEDHISVADFIRSTKSRRCYELPSLNFSAHQDPMTRIELPPTANLLLSLLQHRTGKEPGHPFKFLIDLSQVEADELRIGHSGNFQDQLSRICERRTESNEFFPLRVNHYVAGSIEQYAERSEDYRGFSFQKYLTDKHFEPAGYNYDADTWIDWFIQQVGMTNAENLLFKPILRTSKELAHIKLVKATKTTMQELKILPPNSDNNVEIDDESDE